MARARSRSSLPDGNDPTPFDEVLRRFEQAEEKFGQAIEVEELQAIGMLLREGLISLTTAVYRRVSLPQGTETPQAANFIGWADILLNVLCGGGTNERLRQYINSHARETWQLVNWLTHSRNADKVATGIAISASEITLRTFIQLLERLRAGGTEECPSCRSRNIRTFFDIDTPPDWDYFLSAELVTGTTIRKLSKTHRIPRIRLANHKRFPPSPPNFIFILKP
ncbi:hypothetical protein LMG1861_00918 [Achromobacter piechaudii]|uniref:Uncharacterized protein n=1 Tax=Achromobacter piechaudii TaxID=72556 RepID=A0A6S7DLQ8_9BURK|nr:hypothetical protein LMG1861_00918 [Achromobacter piechaudii]